MSFKDENVNLVANESNSNLAEVRLVLHLAKPLLCLLQTVQIGQVVHKEDALGALNVLLRQGLEPLLASSVPEIYLQSAVFLREFDSFRAKVSCHSGDIVLDVVCVNHSIEDRSLADSCGPEKDHFLL